MDTSNRHRNKGAVSIQLLVILVPVIFGFMGFAYDLGRLYLIRAELNQAANAMALASAKQLIGTTASIGNADAAALTTYDNADLMANKYNFGSQLVGDDSGFLQTEVTTTSYFAAAADAASLASSTSSTSAADGTTAQYAQANITADAPLLFWSLLSLGQARKTPIAARAVAGISAPLCTACGIEPFAIAPLDATDTTNFGFTVGTEYTFGYQCTGTPTPAALTGTAERIPYLIVDRYNSGSALDETQQLFSIGAAGLLPNAATSLTASGQTTYGCLTAVPGNSENVWATASPGVCTGNPPASVQEMLCGLSVRMDVATPSACSSVTDLASVAAPFAADTDVTNPVTDYTSYAGNARRVITVPVVSALATTGMTVLGFREFLLEGSPGFDTTNPSDANGRFIALYIGSPAPVKQGRFDGGCGATSGPGKVVLFQ